MPVLSSSDGKSTRRAAAPAASAPSGRLGGSTPSARASIGATAEDHGRGRGAGFGLAATAASTWLG